MLRVELSEAILTTLAWGAARVENFPWITPPPLAPITSSIALLSQLGFVSNDGKITNDGRSAAQLGIAPRLAKIALEATKLGFVQVGAALISFLEGAQERQKSARGSSDMLRSDELTLRIKDPNYTSAGALSPKTWKDRFVKIVHQSASDSKLQSESIPSHRSATSVEEQIALLLAHAFPDQVGKRRAGSSERYLLSNGSGAALQSEDPLGRDEWIVVVGTQGNRSKGKGDDTITLAAPLPEHLINSHLSRLLTTKEVSTFNTTRGELTLAIQECLGAITISERIKKDLNPDEKHSALLNYLGSESGFSQLPRNEAWLGELQRIRWARFLGGFSELPDCSDAYLRADVAVWLGPFIPAGATLKEINAEMMFSALESLLPWNLVDEYRRLVPRELSLPSGKTRRITYSVPSDAEDLSTEKLAQLHGGAVVEATVQELLGLRASPLLGRTQRPLTFEILSPARRPIQRTNDLLQFWKGSYAEVRKEYRGRYPKHNWPEDPFNC